VLARIRLELERRDMATSQYMLKYYLFKSRLILDQNHLEEARTFCDSALQFTTNLSRGPVFQVIADIDVREKRYEDALDACEEALRVNPNSPDALLMLARTYHAKKDRAMTQEIGGRLLEFWNKADDDFVNLRELRDLLGTNDAGPLHGLSSD
jgi:tetratricopeptide (TPR) repeat protein